MTQQIPLSLLVTVGSTLFPALTDLILSPPFLEHLSSLHIHSLVVQYGRAQVHIPNDAATDGAGSASFQWKRMTVEVIRFTDDFEGLVKRSDAVISHAGSGSILTVLRTPRPLLVVPNSSLMDNHQAELADALNREGYLTFSTVEHLQDNVYDWLRQAEKRESRPFPALEKGRFRTILDETAGF